MVEQYQTYMTAKRGKGWIVPYGQDLRRRAGARSLQEAERWRLAAGEPYCTRRRLADRNSDSGWH